MSADTLLSRLDRVRKSGPASWSARCPSHEDKTPSLSVKEQPDGRLLVFCHGGCTVDEVVGAVGLELADLFPPRPTQPGAARRASAGPGARPTCCTLPQPRRRLSSSWHAIWRRGASYRRATVRG